MLVLGALGFRDRKETDVLQLICSVSLIANDRDSRGRRRLLEDSLLYFEAIAGMTNVYCFRHVDRFFRDVFDSVGDTFDAL